MLRVSNNLCVIVFCSETTTDLVSVLETSRVSVVFFIFLIYFSPLYLRFIDMCSQLFFIDLTSYQYFIYLFDSLKHLSWVSTL